MRTPEEFAKHPLHFDPDEIDLDVKIRPDDGTGYLSAGDYQAAFGPGYREAISSIYAQNYSFSEDEHKINLLDSIKSSVYQKIQSLDDREVAKYLNSFYTELEKRNDEKVLNDFINLDRNIELYKKLDELDYKINQKEQKAYRDLRWFARKGIKLDEDVKEKIFDMYIYGDKDLKKNMESVANALGVNVNDVPYAPYVLRELLLTNPTAGSDDVKRELNYEPPKEETGKKGKRSKAKAIAAAAIMIGAGIAGAGAYKVYKDGENAMGDSSYFFHHFDQYQQYLNAEDKNDIDGDGIPNDIEREHGLDMFDPMDARENWDHDGLTNYDELIKYHTNITKPDTDGDYILDGIEVEKGTNPLKIYTYEGLDDFNLLYTYPHYFRNITNETMTKEDMKKFLDMIPNVEPRYWLVDDGGRYLKGKITYVSMRDPLVQWFAKNKFHIRWEDDPEYGKKGHMMLGNEPLFLVYGTDPNKSLVPPAYYLTHGRRGICIESAVANSVLLLLKGYDSTLAGGDASPNNGIDHPDHEWVETNIDGKIYIVNYNRVVPREDKNGVNTYEKWGWKPESDYDPNWYKDGKHDWE